jgi:hypothetical protein
MYSPTTFLRHLHIPFIGHCLLPSLVTKTPLDGGSTFREYPNATTCPRGRFGHPLSNCLSLTGRRLKPANGPHLAAAGSARASAWPSMLLGGLMSPPSSRRLLSQGRPPRPFAARLEPSPCAVITAKAFAFFFLLPAHHAKETHSLVSSYLLQNQWPPRLIAIPQQFPPFGITFETRRLPLSSPSAAWI